MRKWILAATAAIGLTGSAQAAVITLQGTTDNGTDYTWNYQGSLGPDEGVNTGDRLIIYDFGGYVDGSIFANTPNIATSVEFTSPGGLVTPGFTDNPDLVNLVFTYTGPGFHNAGGPFDPFNFDGLGAKSTFGDSTRSAFFTLTTKNNSGAGTPVFTLGSVATPFAAVPEPTSWALMLSGFGLLGLNMRKRSAHRRVTS